MRSLLCGAIAMRKTGKQRRKDATAVHRVQKEPRRRDRMVPEYRGACGLQVDVRARYLGRTAVAQAFPDSESTKPFPSIVLEEGAGPDGMVGITVLLIPGLMGSAFLRCGPDRVCEVLDVSARLISLAIVGILGFLDWEVKNTMAASLLMHAWSHSPFKLVLFFTQQYAASKARTRRPAPHKDELADLNCSFAATPRNSVWKPRYRFCGGIR